MKRQGEPMTREPATHRWQGFTLVELMISIALVLILILGVNTVFSLTSQTVAAGNALGTIHRANAAVNGTIYQDFKSMVIGTDAPCFVITMQRRFAWRDAADREGDRDGNSATFDVNGDGIEDPVANTTFNHRMHRIDKLCFFARGRYFTQTGAGTRFWTPDPSNTSVPLSSSEAWIKYGMLALPNNAPAAAAQTPGSGDPTSNPNNYYARQWILGRQVTLLVSNSSGLTGGYFEDNSTTSEPLHPLDPDARARGESEQFQHNRYDVALTSMAFYRQKVAGIPNGATGFKRQYWLLHGDFYFRGHPFVSRPIDAPSTARTLPVWVPGCTQFMVEYAGDFFSQNLTSGAMTGNEPDGYTDFQITPAGVRRTRWYGLPRDIDGDGNIDARFDVVPAADVFTSRQIQPWERVVMPASDPNRYIVGWGADDATVNSPRPQMLRLTMTVDDPAGALGGGETFEYVGNLE
jgi:prepilin-type N-terminal cleavage/methylation domain-containing protein